MNEIEKQHPELADAFIDAIPDNVYDKCPCGCDMKWKFAQTEVANHYQRFLEKMLANKQVA